MSFIERLDESLNNGKGNFIKNYTMKSIESYDYSTLKNIISEATSQLIKIGIKNQDCVALPYKNDICTIVLDLSIIKVGAYPVALTADHEMGTSLKGLGIDINYEILLSEPDNNISLTDNISIFTKKFSIRKLCSQISLQDKKNQNPQSLTYVFSSGTTGKPKCIEIVLDNIINDIDVFSSKLSIVSDDSVVLFLPFSVLQQRVLIYTMMFIGGKVSLVEPKNLIELMPVISPSIIVAPPFFYEKILSNYLSKLSKIDKLLGGFITKNIKARDEYNAYPTLISLLIGRPLKRALGGKIKLMLVGMAISKKITIKTYNKLGLPLYEAYGLSEAGIISVNTPKNNKFGSVGMLLFKDSVDIINGEVVIRKVSPWSSKYTNVSNNVNICSHPKYGIFRTGDKGSFDSDGYLCLNGRIKTEIALSSGFKVQPEELEKKISKNAEVLNVVIFGQGYPSLVAIISISKHSTLNQNSIETMLMKYNNNTSKRGVLNKFVLTEEVFTIENGLLNRSLKIDRHAVEKRYKNQIYPLIKTTAIKFEV